MSDRQHAYHSGESASRAAPYHGGEIYEFSVSGGVAFAWIFGTTIVLAMAGQVIFKLVLGIQGAQRPETLENDLLFLAGIGIIAGVCVGLASLVGGRVQKALITKYSGTRPSPHPRRRPRWMRRLLARIRRVKRPPLSGGHEPERHLDDSDEPPPQASRNQGETATLCYAPGARFWRGQFALTVILPMLCITLICVAGATLAYLYATDMALIILGGILGNELYQLHYVWWARRQPTGTIIELTEDTSTIRAYQPAANHYSY